jgi:hypothetical protein
MDSQRLPELSEGRQMSLQAMKCQLAMLRALLRSSDGTATICDATPKQDESFADGGKWRGPALIALATAGLMRHDNAAANSRRPSRKSGLVRRWRLIDAAGARQTVKQLRSTIQRKSSTVAAAERKQLTLLPGEKKDGQVK